MTSRNSDCNMESSQGKRIIPSLWEQTFGLQSCRTPGLCIATGREPRARLVRLRNFWLQTFRNLRARLRSKNSSRKF